jgi:endonuclease YncB( thermonuclease family)
MMRGRVIRVHDGDTFTMLADEGREIKVRLYGVDAPELQQAYGPESGRSLRGLINGRTIQVESRGHDQYGRLLGLISWPGGRSLTYQLVAAGEVWVYDTYCDIEQCGWLRKAQQEARAAGRGLWADESPIAPWEFRRGKR